MEGDGSIGKETGPRTNAEENMKEFHSGFSLHPHVLLISPLFIALLISV